MSRVLITGGTGMVGKHLKKIMPDAIFVGSRDCDLTDITHVRWLISSYTPHTVVHLAAKVGGIQDNIAKAAEYYDDNIIMNTNIVKVCYERQVGRFIGVLSTCAYPDVSDNYPMTEKDLFSGPPAPTNFSYGYTKRALAVQIDSYNKQYGTKYNYIIPCNLYSEYDNFDNDKKMHFITALLKKIKLADDNIDLLGTGSPLRQFMYAGDLAEIIDRTIKLDIIESFNVAPNYNHSIDEMARMALSVADKDCKINYSQPHLDGQYRKDVSSKLLMSIFPDFKFTDLRDGMRRVYESIH